MNAARQFQRKISHASLLAAKKANTAKHERIKQLLSKGDMTKEEIAKAVSVGIATVYRVAKE